MTIAHVDCPMCALDDAIARTEHHYSVMEEGLEVFRKHLEAAYANHPRATQNIPAKMEWATGLVKMYSGMADPETGRPLGWREARRTFAAHTQETRLHEARSPLADAISDVVHTALPAPGDKAWVQCWMVLFEQGYCRPGREAELAAACRALAGAYPDDADDWLREADRLREVPHAD